MENSKKEVAKNKDLFVYATKNEEIATELEKILSEKHSTTDIVRLDSRLLDDLRKDESKENKLREITVDEFLSSKENKDIAETKALTLWNLLTHNADYSESLKRIFTKSEIVNRTNLTNKTLGELLELLSLFGYVEFTKGNYEFRFVFGKEIRQAGLHADIIEAVSNLNVMISRFKSAFDNEDDKNKELEELKENVNKLIVF